MLNDFLRHTTSMVQLKPLIVCCMANICFSLSFIFNHHPSNNHTCVQKGDVLTEGGLVALA